MSGCLLGRTRGLVNGVTQEVPGQPRFSPWEGGDPFSGHTQKRWQEIPPMPRAEGREEAQVQRRATRNTALPCLTNGAGSQLWAELSGGHKSLRKRSMHPDYT